MREKVGGHAPLLATPPPPPPDATCVYGWTRYEQYLKKIKWIVSETVILYSVSYAFQTLWKQIEFNKKGKYKCYVCLRYELSTRQLGDI